LLNLWVVMTAYVCGSWLLNKNKLLALLA